MAKAFSGEDAYEDCSQSSNSVEDALDPQQISHIQTLKANYPCLSNLVVGEVERESEHSDTAQQVCLSAFEGNNDDMVCSHLVDISLASQGGETGSCESPGDNGHVTTTSSLGECHINNLPCELLLYIFSFLSVCELCISVAPVCTAWRDLAKDPSLWTHLVFSFQHCVEGERVRRLLEGSPLLLSLELQNREDSGDLLQQVAASCTKLRELTVKFCDGLTEDTFKLLMENCPDILYLNIEGSYVYGSKSYHMMAGLHQLRYLNLSHCQALDNSGLITIAKQCQSLEYLDIDGITDIHDYAVVCMTKELSHCLKNLFLDGEHLTDAAYQSLQACTKLEKLGVSFCEQMTDKGLSGVSGLKYLTWLKLRKGSQLTPEGLTSLFFNGRLPLLAYVNLGECCLMDDNVLKALSRSCPRLVHLVLHWCWEVTDVGISAVIAACPRLRVLGLVGVVQLTGTAFVDLPSALPDLRILDLEQCNSVDDTILQRIVARKPSLKVLGYWGDPVTPPDTDDDEKDKD